MFASAGLLDELEAAVDRVNDRDLAELEPIEIKRAILDLQRVHSKLAALEAKVAHRFETDGEWAKVGALTPAAYVAAKLKVPSVSSKGGPTTDENGQPGCGPHNRRKSNHTDPWLPDDFTDP